MHNETVKRGEKNGKRWCWTSAAMNEQTDDMSHECHMLASFSIFLRSHFSVVVHFSEGKGGAKFSGKTEKLNFMKWNYMNSYIFDGNIESPAPTLFVGSLVFWHLKNPKTFGLSSIDGNLCSYCFLRHKSQNRLLEINVKWINLFIHGKLRNLRWHRIEYI